MSEFTSNFDFDGSTDFDELYRKCVTGMVKCESSAITRLGKLYLYAVKKSDVILSRSDSQELKEICSLPKKQKYEKALSFFTAAAALNNSEAMYQAAQMYEHGNTEVVKNVTKAVSLFEEAARLGHIEAMYSLAFLYENQFPETDKGGFERKAFILYCIAAAYDHPYAKEKLEKDYIIIPNVGIAKRCDEKAIYMTLEHASDKNNCIEILRQVESLIDPLCDNSDPGI